MLSVNSLTEINRFLIKQLLSNNTDPLVSLFLLATISFAEPLSHHPYFLYMFNFQHVIKTFIARNEWGAWAIY